MAASTIFTAVALAASALSVPAFAADAPRAEVRYNDLSLKTAEGAHMLKVRVERAASHVCGVQGTVSLKERANAAACQRVAVANAMPQVELALANAQNMRVAENSRVSVSAH
jgi:UrcA family protein